MTILGRFSLCGVLSLAGFVAGCAHRATDVDMEAFEAWFLSTKLDRPDPPQPRFLSWEDAKSQGIPRDQMVWIQYWDGKPCERPGYQPIEDVGRFIDGKIEQGRELWLVVVPWDLTSDSIGGFRDLLEACVSSQAKGVIVTEARSRMEGAFPLRPPFRPGPNLSKLIGDLEKKKAEEAQPGATDNPEDAQ